MKLNFSTKQLQASKWHSGITIAAILLLACSGIQTSVAQMKSQKRITSFQSGETSSGTRVSVFSDSALNDYEAFRRGDRFYVRIPFAAFDAAPPKLRGEGFEDLQVQRAGDSVVVSFRLQPGTTARVDQRSNRLDVYFTSQTGATRSSVANKVPNPASSKTIPGIVTLDSTRSQQVQRNPNAAGPIPPDTPGTNRPRVVAPQQTYERQIQEPTTQRDGRQEASSRSSNRTEPVANKTQQSPAANVVNPAVKSDGPAPVTPLATSSYPVPSATPYSTSFTRPAGPVGASTASTEWSKRFDVVARWLSANRVPAAVGAAVLFGLLVFGFAMLHRRRRKALPSRRSKIQGVQPKYSPENDFDGFEDLGDEVYETVFDDYQTEAQRSKPVVDLPFADDSVGGSHQWADDFSETTVAQPPVNDKPVTSSYVPVTPTMPIHAMKHEEYEREVFEL